MPPERVASAERLVGRADELRRIEQACGAARRGRGALVLVSGEAGIGKTRFGQEVVVRCRRIGVRSVSARCWGEGGAPPMWPWQPILADLCGPDSARLFGPTTPPSDAAAVEADRFSRFAGVTEALAGACERQPACIVVDDIHAADADTLLLTRFIARSLPRLPLALVLSRRREEPGGHGLEARLVDEIEREADLIVLRHFDMNETADLLANHGLRDLPPDVVLALLRVTGGNPLFLRRIAALGAPDSEGALPGGLRVAIDEALSRLRPDTRRVLRAGAVLGLSPTVAEVAAVAEAEPATVLEAVGDAAGTGLVTPGADRFSFAHDLVRSALEDGLPAADRLAAHARAAAIMAGDAASEVPSEQLARRARHALAAASRSAADARLAAAACRDAAAAMVGSFAYERADELLSAAVELHLPSRLGAAPADLLVDWAQAALLCGRLGEARDRFDRAASAAERTGDPVLFAEAAVGLGGLWINERRAPVERARVLGLQRAALAGLAPEPEALRCRLAVRLAAENVYVGGPIEPVLDALAACRRTGDTRALAEALSLSHHALLTHEHVQQRLEIADELVEVASVAGYGVLGLLGLCWRTVDLFHLADGRAPRALEDLRQRADALACQSMLYIVSVMDVMRLIRAGRLDEAETAAERSYELGVAVGDPDAPAFFGSQLFAVRWIQGRDVEVLDAAEELARSPTLVTTDFALRSVAAAIAARAGEVDRARAALGRLTTGGLAELPPSSTWLAGMWVITEAAVSLGDADLAREVYDLLSPYAEQPVMPSVAVVCLGSTERALGLAAATFADPDLAVQHLEGAVAADRRLGNRPLTTITSADLATILARRGRGDDVARAVALLEQAVGEGDGMGMSRRVEAWRAELDALTGRAGSGSPTAVAGDPAAGVGGNRVGGVGQAGNVGPAGDALPVGDAGQASDAGQGGTAGPGGDAGPATVTVPGGVTRQAGGDAQTDAAAAGGSDRDARIGAATGRPRGVASQSEADVGSPGQRRGVICREGRSWRVEVDDRRVLVADLVGMGYLAELVAHPGRPVSADVLAGADPGNMGAAGSRQELLDRQARDAYAARARELAAELAGAEADNDLGRAERLRVQLDALVEQLEAAAGLGGRPRVFPHQRERARTSVRKAIKRAIDEIDNVDPLVAEPLRNGITTGSVCCYSPPPGDVIVWSVRRVPQSNSSG